MLFAPEGPAPSCAASCPSRPANLARFRVEGYKKASEAASEGYKKASEAASEGYKKASDAASEWAGKGREVGREVF